MSKIDSQLRFVLPVCTSGDDVTVWAYHIPIAVSVFEANYRILAATKAAIFGNGPRYAFEVGGSIAGLRLRDEARKDALERGDVDKDDQPSETAVNAFSQEIQRLTTVCVATESGFDNVPVTVALQRNLIDAEDWKEAESNIIFFTCVYYLTRKAEREKAVSFAALVSRGSITSLGLTEWIDSYRKSITAAGSAPVAG